MQKPRRASRLSNPNQSAIAVQQTAVRFGRSLAPFHVCRTQIASVRRPQHTFSVQDDRGKAGQELGHRDDEARRLVRVLLRSVQAHGRGEVEIANSRAS